MNKDQAKQLADRAQSYIGRQITLNILDQQMELKKQVECTFTDISSISITERGDQPNIELYAILEDIKSNEMLTHSLKSVVDSFARE